MKAPRLAVEVGHPETFPGKLPLGEAAGEEGPSGGEAIEPEGQFDTLIPHPSPLARAFRRNDKNPISFGTKSLRYGGKALAAENRWQASKPPSHGAK